MSELLDKNVSVYVVSHKPFNPPDLVGYIPIAVGKLLENCPEGFLRDDTGDSISDKNESYCELTALYWIWKNAQKADSIGLCHYRRYFTRYPLSSSPQSALKAEEIEQILMSNDVILPKKWRWKGISVGRFYSEKGAGRADDLVKVRKALEQIDSRYLPAYDSLLAGSAASYCNMFVMRRDSFESYCEWLFMVLESLEQVVDLSCYSEAEKRVFGYIGELLLNVWVKFNDLRVAEMYMLNTNASLKQRVQLVRRCSGL